MSAAEEERARLIAHGTGRPYKPAGQFDPAKHSATEVLAYLDSADDDEQQRVLDAEASGKARKSIVNV